MPLLTTDKRKISRFNWHLFAVVVLLCVAGLVNLYSAQGYWGGGGNMPLFWSQIAWVGIGIGLMLLISFFDYRLLERIATPVYVLSMALLLLVLLFGHEVAGHRSWLAIGGFGIQPSEFAKLALVVMLAGYFSGRPRPEGVSLLGMWRPFLYSAIPAVLVVLQGDLGSAIFFALIFGTYAWFGRLKGKGVATLVLLAFLGAAILYFFGLSGYQKARFASFVDPTMDAKGSGYHMIQSRIAVGSGKFLGKGFLKGNINKLRYLPEKHTDFIFPVLAEEWGFAGSAVVLLLYFLLFAVALDITKNARDRLGVFLALGVVAFLFWHVVINLGGVLGLMPMTGVTLPFMSYGGSSMMITMGALGLLFSINMRRHRF
jgi:rod shape determining protein RodA